MRKLDWKNDWEEEYVIFSIISWPFGPFHLYLYTSISMVSNTYLIIVLKETKNFLVVKNLT